MLRRGFTLIELIVVLAISAVLLGIITVPIVQSLNITRASQAFANAQDRARTLIRTIETEVANSAGVRDNSGIRGAVAITVPGANGDPETIILEHTKLDILKPAEGEPIRGADGGFIDPDTGREDPTLEAPKGQVVLPVAPGTTIVRYFIGIRDPFNPYNNPYDGLLMARGGGRDNLFVLFRAEVPVYIFDSNLGQYRVNSQLFFDQDRDGNPDTVGPLLDDPFFFDPDVEYLPYAVPLPGDPADKATMVQQWLNRATIVTEVSQYDMITPIFNQNTREVLYNGNVPEIVPLVRFQPTRLSNEPAQGMMAVRTGEETDNPTKIGPDVYRTDYGSWASVFLRVWPSEYPASWNFSSQPAFRRPAWGQGGSGFDAPYLVGRPRFDGFGNEVGVSLFAYDPTTGTPDVVGGVEIFDLSLYEALKNANAAYPFSRAIQAANSRSGWLANPLIRRVAIPVFADPAAGKVFASFDIREVGFSTAGNLADPNNRVPTIAVGDTFTPNNDPDVGAGTWTDPIFSTVNRRFNKLWVDWPALAPGLDRARYVKRFIDLRQVNQPDGTPSPINPAAANGLPRGYIVPGSETVVGPDQRPGPNYGRPVRYTRVTQRPVGPNQYFINYVDQPEPDWTDLGFTVPADIYDPEFFDSNNFVSAILQPQFRAGYLEFNSRFGEPIPSQVEGNIYVSYRFQFTEPADVVAVDYDSTEVLEIVLTIKNYPPVGLLDGQTVTLKGSAKVRNFLR